jgi:hypothetical protein
LLSLLVIFDLYHIGHGRRPRRNLKPRKALLLSGRLPRRLEIIHGALSGELATPLPAAPAAHAIAIATAAIGSAIAVAVTVAVAAITSSLPPQLALVYV